MMKPKPTTRRQFLKMSFGGCAVLAASGGTAFLFREDIEALGDGEVVRFLRSNFDYLTLAVTDDEMRQFYGEYRRYVRPIYRAHWQRWIRGRDTQHYERTLDELATTFLLSTDFFLHGADESRPVQYVRLYNAYASPCWNPLLTMQPSLPENAET